jgi:AraC-like DNA-binding protein/quercetin dioxygenase-like cupin family protein
MKAVREQINVGIGESFSVRAHTLEKFDSPWHFHPEYELTYIKKSSGKRFVGDSVQDFEEGDLALIGAMLPHYWQNKQNTLQAESIVIQFKYDFAGMNLWEIPECGLIKKMLQKSATGLTFDKSVSDRCIVLMEKIVNAQNSLRLAYFLELLHLLSEDMKAEKLSSNGFKMTFPDSIDKKIEKINDYIITNFKQEISLDMAAFISNMTKESFCRYFKKVTQKTFSEYVNDFRLGYACKELKESTKSVSEIAFDCGYNHVHYFNRLFSQKMGVSPGRYRNV